MQAQQGRNRKPVPWIPLLHRLLQHAPPWGCHRARYYGVLAPGACRTLRPLQIALRRGMSALAPAIARLREPSERRRPLVCERCGSARLRHFDFGGSRRVRTHRLMGRRATAQFNKHYASAPLGIMPMTFDFVRSCESDKMDSCQYRRYIQRVDASSHEG